MRPWFMVLAIGAMLLGATVLSLSITQILALLRKFEIARLPAAAESEVTFDAKGTYVLHIEQKRFGAALRRAKFTLRDSADGRIAPSSPVIFRTTTSGFSTVRLSVRQFEIEHAGVYSLLVSDIDGQRDTSGVRLIFTRPYASALFLLILCTVFGGASFIGGLAFTALLGAGKL